MKEIFQQIDAWLADEQRIALATVVDSNGSAPRPTGARLVLTQGGSMWGSVSGGCVESDVYEHAQKVLSSGVPALVAYGPAEPDSFHVGLSCDGRIEVLIEAFEEDGVWQKVRATVEAARPAAMAVVIEPASLRGKRLGWGGEAFEAVGTIDDELDAAVAHQARRLLADRRCATRTFDVRGEPHRVFIETLAPPPRLYLVGATHIAVSLCRMAREVGFEVCVIEPRTAFTQGDRFRDAKEVRSEWPVDVLDGALLDADAYVLTLTHETKFDLPTLARALRSDVRYIGALGSRGTHEKRKRMLREQGFGDEALARIHTPVGLDLGGRSPEEIALAIVAEMVATRYGRRGDLRSSD